MATITPDEALDWYRNLAMDEGRSQSNQARDELPYDVAVGTGTAQLSSGNTQLDAQVHRNNITDSNVSISSTSNVGEFEAAITVTGGTEVPADTDITEIGVWARDPDLPQSDFTGGSESTNDSDDVMLYRETRPAITVPAGNRKTIRVTIVVTEN